MQIDERTLPLSIQISINNLQKCINEENSKSIDLYLDDLWGSINGSQHGREISRKVANHLKEKYLGWSNENKISYISGWQGLNLPDENGLTADWHPLLYFKDNQPNDLYDSSDNPLEYKGIKLRKFNLRFLQGEFYVASFARCIADLVYSDKTQGLRNCVSEFLDDSDELELYGYLKIINKEKNVEDFMKYELTKLYFKDKKC